MELCRSDLFLADLELVNETEVDAAIGCVVWRTYIFVVVECIEDVVRQAREQIDDEPALEVIHPDHL